MLDKLFKLLNKETRLYLGIMRKLLFSPRQFGRETINTSEVSTKSAIKFYLANFTIVFGLLAGLSFLSFYSGHNKFRELAVLAIQVGVATPILFALIWPVWRGTTLRGMLEAVLYADAAYLLIGLTLASIPLSALSYLYAEAPGETDVVATEFWKCLADSSYLYLAIQGAGEHFLASTTNPASELISDIRQYEDLVFVLPFCLLFGFLLNGRFGVQPFVAAALAYVMFFLVVGSWNAISQSVQNYTVAKSGCIAATATRVKAKYSTELLARQSAFPIAVESKALFGDKDGRPRVRAERGEIVIDVADRPAESANKAQSKLQQSYCPSVQAFARARSLGIPVIALANINGEAVRLPFEPTPCTR